MLIEVIKRVMEWIPGCSPEVPKTWQQATIQAFTCFVRLLTALILLYAVVRLALDATH